MLQGSFNTRAVLALSGKPWLYRSAELDHITADDETILTNAGITQVIDLRSREERNIPERKLNTKILPMYGEHNTPPLSTGITETYLNLLNNSGPMFAEIANLVATEPGLSLIHCRVGKDRTGLSVALLMATSGASNEAIIADYVLSEVHVRKARETEIREQLANSGLDAETAEKALALHLSSPAKVMSEILEHLDTEYGSAVAYLTGHGATNQALTTLRESYTANSAEASTIPETLRRRA